MTTEKYNYPRNYHLKTLEEQKTILAGIFNDSGKRTQGTPGWAEGQFAIPNWRKHVKTYPEAVQAVIDTIASTRPFQNYLDTERIKETDEKRLHTNTDWLILPAQFGKRWAGVSVEGVRRQYAKGEVGLGAYEVGCMLLSHPERLQDYNDLWIDCPGDKYPDADGVFCAAPCLHFDDGELKFDAGHVGSAHDDFGSASAFLPQTLAA
jgi:hypothetical protein